MTLTVCMGAWLSSACGGDDEDDGGPSGGSSSGGKAGATNGGAAGEASGGSSSSGGGGASSGGKNSSAGSSGASGAGSGGSGGDCTTKVAVASCSEDGTDPNVETSACVELYVAGIAEAICGAREVKAEGCSRSDQLRYICVGPNNSDFWYSEDSQPEYWSNNEGGCEINGGSWCPL